jgi:hypothetical protein
MKTLEKPNPTEQPFKPCRKSKGSTSGFLKKATTMSFQSKLLRNSRRRKNLKTGQGNISLKKR